MTCQMAGERCPETQTVLVRIADVGDRRMCGGHLATLDRLGMSYRRLDVQPAGRPEWLRRGVGHDLTGALSS